MNRFINAVTVTGLLTVFQFSQAMAGELSVRVLNKQQKPVASARVLIPSLDRSTQTDEEGIARFSDVPAGQVLIDIEAGHDGHMMQRAQVSDSASTTIDVVLDHSAERVVVTAMAIERRALDMATPAHVLSGDALIRAKAMTIGETVEYMPGVSASSFGPGASRPVIRGQGGARVQMLSDGLGAMDASTISADHAVTVEPLVAEQVEVLRGPATLLYGSGAIGGVVNVIDQRIPQNPIAGVEAGLELRTQTVNNEQSGAVKIDAGVDDLAFHFDAYKRDTDNLKIPGDAERFPEAEAPDHADEELAHGKLPNSDMRNDGFAIGSSWIGSAGMIGISFHELNSNYGIPGAHHHESPPGEPDEEEAVRIDLQQQRYDLKARWDHPFAGVENIKWRYGLNQYTHTELEGSEIGTVFNNDAYESRLELAHHPFAGIQGVIGVHWGERDFIAIGDEAFVPPSQTDSKAIFIVEEKRLGPVRVEAGLRAENVRITPESTQTVYDENAMSWSLGAVWEFAPHWNMALSYASAERHPFTEELYANGPHIATQTFEIGDESLTTEHAKNIDVGLRYNTDRHQLSIALYQNTVADFIYANATGVEQDDLPVYQYQQADARLNGMEISWDWLIARTTWGDVESHVFLDETKGKLDEHGHLPRIPAKRLGFGLSLENDTWSIGGEYVNVDDQTRTAELETPTDGYQMLNAHVMYRLYTGDITWDAFLRGTNLLDEDIRLHASFLKDVAPQAGRSLTAGVRLHF